MTAHQQWLAAHLQTAGRLVIDDGAIEAIRENTVVCYLWVFAPWKAILIVVMLWSV